MLCFLLKIRETLESVFREKRKKANTQVFSLYILRYRGRFTSEENQLQFLHREIKKPCRRCHCCRFSGCARLLHTNLCMVPAKNPAQSHPTNLCPCPFRGPSLRHINEFGFFSFTRRNGENQSFSFALFTQP